MKLKIAFIAYVLAICLVFSSCHAVMLDYGQLDPDKPLLQKDLPETPLDMPYEPEQTLQQQIHTYLSEIFDKAFQPYYEGLSYEISDYNEEISENEFSSTFAFTMYHLDSGGDIGSERGKLSQSNVHLKTSGTYTDGKAEIKSVLLNTNPVLHTEYSVPVENIFPDENATLSLVGYIKDIYIGDNKLSFDKLFFLTSPENDELLGQLGVTSEDMSDGYYLYNPEEKAVLYEIAQDADFYKFEIPEDRPPMLVESELSMIADTLNTQTPLYQIVVKNSVITTISEYYVP